MSNAFFLVGSPRSGTTLLQGLLANHPNIHSFPETHFFYALFEDSRFRRWSGLINPIKVRPQLLKITNLLNEPEFIKTIEKLNSRNAREWVKIYQAMLELCTSKAEKSVWIEKTPMHLHFIPQIEQYVSEVKFIHIIRDGISTIASQIDVGRKYPEQWGEKWSVQGSTKRWLFDYSLHKKYLGHASHHFVLFEDLISNPKLILSRITDFMGVNFDPKMLSARISNNHIVNNLEPWKEGATASILNPMSKESILSDDEFSWIKQQISSCKTSIFSNL